MKKLSMLAAALLLAVATGAVMNRYSEAARDRQPELCCPVSYDPHYLAVTTIADALR